MSVTYLVTYLITLYFNGMMLLKNPKVLVALTSVLCVICISVFILINNAGPGGSDFKNYHRITKPAEDQSAGNVPGTVPGGEKINLLPDSRDLSELELGNSLEQDKYKAILLNYTAQFSQVQSQYIGKLNNLLKRAQVDIKANGGQKKELVKISYQYVKEAKALEQECDTNFYSILSDMKKELQQGHFPLAVADEAEKQYKQQKKERERYLSTKALEYVKSIAK